MAIDQYMRKTTFKNSLRMKYKFSSMWFRNMVWFLHDEMCTLYDR